MEEQALSAIVGVLGTIILGLIGLCGILLRRERNNRNQGTNPHLGDRFAAAAESNKVLLAELTSHIGRLTDTVRRGFDDMGGKLDGARDILIEVRAILRQASTRGTEG